MDNEKRKKYFTSAWFPWYPGKIALELWGAILPGSPSIERKIKVALIVVSCFILSDSTGLACQDLGEERTMKCFEEPCICIFAYAGSLLHMWPGRSVPLEKATGASSVHQDHLLAWHSAELEKTSYWPWNKHWAAQMLGSNSIFCTSCSTFVSPVDILEVLIWSKWELLNDFFSFPTVLERLIASCASCFSGYFDVLIFLAYIHLWGRLLSHFPQFRCCILYLM